MGAQTCLPVEGLRQEPPVSLGLGKRLTSVTFQGYRWGGYFRGGGLRSITQHIGGKAQTPGSQAGRLEYGKHPSGLQEGAEPIQTGKIILLFQVQG